MRALSGLLLLLLLAGCGSSASYYRLEEWGDGWKLEVKSAAGSSEGQRRFVARWIEGDKRSLRLTNLDDSHGNIRIVNTFYLEVDQAGTVTNGQFKRVVMPAFERRAYDESHAQWFKVNAGSCVLDQSMRGLLDIQCEGGYEFKGNVEPARDIRKIEPEKKR